MSLCRFTTDFRSRRIHRSIFGLGQGLKLSVFHFGKNGRSTTLRDAKGMTVDGSSSSVDGLPSFRWFSNRYMSVPVVRDGETKLLCCFIEPKENPDSPRKNDGFLKHRTMSRQSLSRLPISWDLLQDESGCL